MLVLLIHPITSGISRLWGWGDRFRRHTADRAASNPKWNTDIIPELTPSTEDVVLYKRRFSGFFETDLDLTLKRSGIKYLIVAGCTIVGVKSTIRDAMFRDYSCVLLEDCHRTFKCGH